LAILGVVSHYVTEDGQLEHHILALKDIDNEHDSSHLAAAILEVVDEWGFASKLEYFMIDNASNNDTMMRSLSLSQYNSPFPLTSSKIPQASFADMTSDTIPKFTDSAAKVISSISPPKLSSLLPTMRSSNAMIQVYII
jgi:hypothetical protein